MRRTIDDDECQSRPQLLQFREIYEVPIESANHAEGWYFDRRDLGRRDHLVLISPGKCCQSESVLERLPLSRERRSGSS